ncbi:CDP-glucose 4,6-dehydratase [Parachlamydia acanthamoebae]|jgi:CDP-glucose 4,6-dehydratase|uniref:CDP-glucose 4,6-dehydratase n=2 Tax=Parachlamydia acanthamoebae TaxID=83552 RepID=F8KV60_PARAV|nr:CDP-glucose 4,6-dehydratase [Parachlamydia acanthamoebae]CCB87582.1 cDP-glucose 4,6-dehydratase [Parachlamydia acanthamoebae UV-7]
MINYFGDVFKGLPVLITGHTGFKGSWLSIWLQALGAKVIGYSLPAPTQPSHFSITHLDQKMVHITGDICHYDKIYDTIQEHQPAFVFHLAAQSLVLKSYTDPKETFDANVGGTVNVLEAVRNSECVKGCLVITTDKCYENKEWTWGYRENDTLGGSDPYSASKAMAELATQAYRASFFESSKCVASARAGNVIGGGDFSDFRLVPDSMKALMSNKLIEVRNPHSVRPWLHVLDALSGYLCLAQNLLQHEQTFAGAWNFGPMEQQGVSVEALVQKAVDYWGEGDWINLEAIGQKREMHLLRLNWDQAAHHLKWHPVYNWHEALEDTVKWFKAFHNDPKVADNENMYQVALDHIKKYCIYAQKRELKWAESKNLLAVEG